MKTNAAATVAQKLNQGTPKGMGCFIPFLNFLWLLSFFQEKESDKPGIQTASYLVLVNGPSDLVFYQLCFAFLFFLIKKETKKSRLHIKS